MPADTPAHRPPPPEEPSARLAARVRADPASVGTVFPAVGREAGRGPGPSGDPDGVLGPTVQDAARAEVLSALRDALHGDPAEDRLADEVAALYRFGDAEEKRAVLRALPLLGPRVRPAALIADALRGNDPRLIAAALGTSAAAALDDHEWRHGVLKCLFSDVPLDAVADLDTRADAELARMAQGYIAERTAAGRTIGDDARRLLAAGAAHRAPPAPGAPGTPDREEA